MRRRWDGAEMDLNKARSDLMVMNDSMCVASNNVGIVIDARFLFTPSKTPPLVSSSPPPKALTKQRNRAILRSHRLRRLSSILSSLLSRSRRLSSTGPQISNPQQIGVSATKIYRG
ncbi:hypothetical protein Syun_010529 [Stephania yunnanensis]|uniref:Uncharacterized protein n=1 Tax=Stephania yunnanensis TaxID=152371 RepID=A0AAP0KJA4_9MAGN